MIPRLKQKTEGISLRAHKKKGRAFSCPSCGGSLTSGETAPDAGDSVTSDPVCAIEKAIALYRAGEKVEASNYFLQGVKKLNEEKGPHAVNWARRIANACNLYEKRFPTETELECPKNSLVDIKSFSTFQAWMESKIVETLEEKDEKFALTLEYRDLLMKNAERIQRTRFLRDQALEKYQEYEASLSEKLEDLERLLAGARTGIEKMQGHLLDDSFEAEKKAPLIEKIQQKKLVEASLNLQIQAIKEHATFINVFETETTFKTMWQEIGVADVEARLEALKLSRVVDHNIGSDFESACEYFVNREISDLENASNLIVLPGVFFEGISLPMKVTGEFDFIVGFVNEAKEFEIARIFECKNSSTAVQSDIRKKIEAMSYFTGQKIHEEKFFTKCIYTVPGTKTKYTFNCNSFKRFTNVGDIYRNLVYFTLPGPLVYLEPFELLCKLTLASTKSVFRSPEFYQEAFDELHKIEEVDLAFEQRQSGYESLLQMVACQSILILVPIIDFEEIDLS